jgi:hypothetical protein
MGFVGGLMGLVFLLALMLKHFALSIAMVAAIDSCFC